MMFRALAWSYWVPTPETAGYFTGGALVPAIIAYFIAARRPIMHFRRFGLAFGGMSLLLFVLSNEHVVGLHEHLRDLAKEAAGTKEGESRFGVDAVARDLMRDIFQGRKELDEKSAPFAPVLAQIYSAESFSSKEQMQKTLDAVRGTVALDLRFSELLKGIPDRTQARLNQTLLSDSEKQDFMKGIREAYGNSKVLNVRDECIEAEKRWGEATSGLYEFAMANADLIRPDGSHLVIASRGLRKQFSDRMAESQKLRDQLRERNAALESAQREVMKEAGITRKDLGLAEGDSPAKQ